MIEEKLKDNFAFQLTLISFIAFLIIFLPQRVFVELSLNSFDHAFWNENLLGRSFGPKWLFTGSAILFLITFLTCLLASFIISITLKNLKTGFGASIILCMIAISPTILVIITIIIDPDIYYVPFFYYIRYELSIAIVITSILGAIGGSVYGSLLIRNEFTLPPKDPLLALKEMELLKRCIIEGIVAIIVPQILVIVHLVIFRHSRPSIIVFILVLTLGFVSFIISILGYNAIREGKLKRGMRCKLFLRLTLFIGSALSFLIVGFTTFTL